MEHFYELAPGAGVRSSDRHDRTQWSHLDDPATMERVLDFTDGNLSRVTLRIPTIHCIACVWLLENLFRLHPGIGQSTVNFPRREVAIVFSPEKIKLGELAALLASIGYAPHITLDKLEDKHPENIYRKQWVQTGIAGFGFGNIMLASLPFYMGLDSFSAPMLRVLLGWVSLAIALPVATYSASDYWRSAAASIRQRMLTLDVPIALGLAALYIQSAYEILSQTGHGYLDSLCGLIFFLLCGRIFQRKTHDRIEFDRDYKSFFPLAVTRRGEEHQEKISISRVQPGDRLVIRHGEIVPADGVLVSAGALIDYSFVTGESAPVAIQKSGRICAGGRQMGGAIEVETVRPVSQSYLTSLWNHKVFAKDSGSDLRSLTNAYSRRFTKIVIGIACGAAVGWALAGDVPRGIKAFTSVLIVACPCALALAAPFTLGTAQRVLARLSVFVRNPIVLERMAKVGTVVFDKTGTLTEAGNQGVGFEPEGLPLSPDEAAAIKAVASQSAHPHAVGIVQALPVAAPVEVQNFMETPGKGVEGTVNGRRVKIGSGKWVFGAQPARDNTPSGSVSHVSIDGRPRGKFVMRHALRQDTAALLQKLRTRYSLALLSGDNEREKERFRGLLGPGADLRFNSSPVEKLEWIESLKSGSTGAVMMVGDGLNDAGALKSSDIGVAVVDRIGAFFPASDVVMEAAQVSHLDDIMSLAKASVKIVRLSFGISAAYNVVGIGIGAAGVLSPVICAILMPVSSVSVVLFAYGMTRRAGGKLGLG